MNRKQLILLIVVGVAVGAFGFISYNARKGSWENSDKLGQKLIKNFPINDVERISIKQSQGQVSLAKKSDVWTVQERADYPANFETISEFLRKVWDLKMVQPVEIGATRLARLDLVPPDKDKGTNSGTLVEFKDNSGKTLNSLLLGKKHMREGHNESGFGGGGGWPDGRYVMVGSDAQTVAVVSETFSNVEAKPEEWLNKDFFKVEKIKLISITTTNATNNWKLSRESETNEWKLADLKTGEQLDTGKL